MPFKQTQTVHTNLFDFFFNYIFCSCVALNTFVGTKTNVPILVVPVTSITKCYCCSSSSGGVEGGIGGEGIGVDDGEDGIGYEMQLCTKSRSHGHQLFTFIIENELLCEEWCEIIKTKACLL